MTTYPRIAAEAGDQYLAAIGQAQENFLNAMAMSRAWAPAVPAANAPIGDYPTPREMVGVSFGFAQKLLKQQQDFAQKLLKGRERDSHRADQSKKHRFAERKGRVHR